MKVLDLFSGLGGWSQAFKDRGHEVITYELYSKFNPDVCCDIMDVDSLPDADVILASPPCNKFSCMTIGRYWIDGKPKPETKESIKLVIHTLKLISDVVPKFWILENPMGMMRKILGNPPLTVYYAQFGEDRLKPTDLWGRLPNGLNEFVIKDRSLLEYTKCPRGSKVGGTQGMSNGPERAKIPYQLSLKVCKLCENGIREVLK